MKQVIFITATDTNAGKTFVATHLLRSYAAKGFSTCALKPIACGGGSSKQGWRNHDAEILLKEATLKKSYSEINPFIYPAPCSPNIAARKLGEVLTVSALTKAIKPAFLWDVDYLLIEGCGGWYVPLNDSETLADLVKALDIPVLLVVAVRLGCLNHALLTAKAFELDNINCIGWIANCCDAEFGYIEETIQTLQQFLPWKLLERISFQNKNISVGV